MGGEENLISSKRSFPNSVNENGGGIQILATPIDYVGWKENAGGGFFRSNSVISQFGVSPTITARDYKGAQMVCLPSTRQFIERSESMPTQSQQWKTAESLSTTKKEQR